MLLYREPDHYLVVNSLFYDLIFPCNCENERTSLSPTSLFPRQGRLRAVSNNTTPHQEKTSEMALRCQFAKNWDEIFFFPRSEWAQTKSVWVPASPQPARIIFGGANSLFYGRHSTTLRTLKNTPVSQNKILRSSIRQSGIHLVESSGRAKHIGCHFIQHYYFFFLGSNSYWIRTKWINPNKRRIRKIKCLFQEASCDGEQVLGDGGLLEVCSGWKYVWFGFQGSDAFSFN